MVTDSYSSSQNVNYANSAGSATTAGSAAISSKLGRDGNINNPMTFLWRGQSGQPTWLWGSNDGSDNYVYNPSNFSVNYAASANTANSATRAVQDQHGNNIFDAYLRKSDAGVYYGKYNSSVSFANNTQVTGASLTIPAGIYVITARSFINGHSTTASTKRHLSVKSPSTTWDLQQIIVPSSCNLTTILNGTVITQISSSTTINAVVLQNSGTTITGNCALHALKVK